uniref:ETS-related transcription factor Elf-1-like n=1 Tax=Oncorhynchus kisutch TaxID=8019 RepID=A0A8C7JY87_ONCKI
MSSMLQQTELIFEFASDHVNNGLQLDEHLAYPAVIVEQIPQSHLLSYTGLACEQTHTEDHLLTTGNISSVTLISLSTLLVCCNSPFQKTTPLLQHPTLSQCGVICT